MCARSRCGGCWVDDLTFESADPMPARDAIALGPPSVLSTWVFDLLREICDLVPERAAARAIDREDPVEASGDRRPLIYLSHFPSPSLQAECGHRDRADPSLSRRSARQRPLSAAWLERQRGRSAPAANGRCGKLSAIARQPSTPDPSPSGGGPGRGHHRRCARSFRDRAHCGATRDTAPNTSWAGGKRR